MKLIAFTGLPRCGKDTAAAAILYHGFEKRAFAGPLKEAAAHLLGRTLGEMEGTNGFDREAVLPEWGFSTRHFLQWLGTEGMRRFQDDFWIRRMELDLAKIKDKSTARIVITDCRFPNEVDMVHRLGGKVIRIERTGCIQSSHESDKPVPFDILIRNEGSVEEFRSLISCLVDTIRNT